MDKCNNCGNTLKDGLKLTCPNCGALICMSCANQTQQICPYCYSNLDFFG